MIIGLCGYAGSGKDTVAKSLKLRYGFERVAFADKLKQLALELDPILSHNGEYGDHLWYYNLSGDVQKWGWANAKEEPSTRRYLQILGNSVREVLGERVWVQAVGAQITTHLQEGKGVVLTDVRYTNEAEYVRSLGGKLVRVQRPNVGPVNDHKTESLLDTFTYDYVLENDGTERQLGAKVTTMHGVLNA